MNFTETFAFVSVGLILVGIPVGAYTYESWLDSQRMATQPQEVTLFGWAYENGGWTPNEIVLKKGVPVKITLMTRDTAHSLVIPELGVDSGPVSPGHPKVIEFTPMKTGTFTFYCGTLCSTVHHFMKGKITVEG